MAAKEYTIRPAGVRTFLYCTILVFQIVTMGLAAGVVSCSYWRCNGEDAAIAVMVWSSLQIVYLCVSLTASRFSPSHILASAMADVASLTFFLIFGVGAIGASTGLANSDLIRAEVAFGWMVNILNLASLLLVIMFVLSKCCSYELWRQSLRDLQGGRIRLTDIDEEHQEGTATPKSDEVEREEARVIAVAQEQEATSSGAAAAAEAPAAVPAESLSASASASPKCPHCNH